jgi:hypothetical protein
MLHVRVRLVKRRSNKLSEGIYFIRLYSPNCEKTRKAVITE